jgi:hypothetical protein
LHHECEFYDKVETTGNFVCRDELTNMYLVDIARMLHVIMGTSETQRELQTQALRSQAMNNPTEELKRLIGISDASTTQS